MSEQKVDSPEENVGFNPLVSGPVKERSYTRPTVTSNPNEVIPEPVIIPPSMLEMEKGLNRNIEEISGEEKSEKADKKAAENDAREVWGKDTMKGSANPHVEQLDTGDKKQAAKAMVEAVMDGYSQVNAWANKLVQFNPRKTEKMFRDGLINPDIALNIHGTPIPVANYFEEYNKSVDGVFYVSESFKEKVSPVMLRVFQKRNIGMTDEQLLAYYFGKDILEKGIIGYSLVQTNKDMIKQLKEMSSEMASSNRVTSNSNQNFQETKVNENPESPKTPSPSNSGSTERQYEVVIEESNKREYVEPEETKANDVKNEFHEAIITDVTVENNSIKSEVVNVDKISHGRKPGKKEKIKVAPKPKSEIFGDPSILADMENIAKKEKNKYNK